MQKLEKQFQSSIKEAGDVKINSERIYDRMAEIINFIPDATFVINPQGRVMAWNKAAEKMSGIKANEIVGKGNFQYTLPFYGDRRPVLIDLVLQSNEEIEKSYISIDKQGKTLIGENFCPAVGPSGVYLWAKASRLYDSQGKTIGAIECIRDISSRKQTEAAQTKELKKFQILYDLALAMSAENSMDDNLTLIVEKTRELLGTDTAYIMLKDETHNDMYMRTSSGMKTTALKKIRLPFGKGIAGMVAVSRQGHIFEDYFNLPSNIERIIDDIMLCEGLISGIAVPLQVGLRSLGVLFLSNRTRTSFTTSDLETLSLIGNLAAVEITRKKAESALKDSEQLLADIINFLPDATFAIDLEGRVIAWNKAIEEMTGVSAGLILGKNNFEYALPFYGTRRPVLIDLFFNSNEEIENHYFFISRDKEALVAETPVPCIAGVPVFLWGIATPLYDTRGKLIGAIESIRDITEKKLTEEKLQQTNQNLETILDGTVNALATMAEKRDPYTAGHQKRVARLACAIAEELGIIKDRITEIYCRYLT